MKISNKIEGPILEDWSRSFTPADVTLCALRTGEQIQEISLVAAKVKEVERPVQEPYAGGTKTYTVIERYVAAGRAAREYEHAADTVVFSPLRRGQIAHYHAAEFMFKAFLKEIGPKILAVKPVVCIRVQEQTTEVEERALIDAGVQAGARQVFLYQESLAALLDALPRWKELQNGYAVHIEARG